MRTGQSCLISVAEDGDVAFTIATEQYRSGIPCTAVVSRGRASLHQDGAVLLDMEPSPNDLEAILAAPRLRVFNVQRPGRPDEAIDINRQVDLVVR